MTAMLQTTNLRISRYVTGGSTGFVTSTMCRTTVEVAVDAVEMESVGLMVMVRVSDLGAEVDGDEIESVRLLVALVLRDSDVDDVSVEDAEDTCVRLLVVRDIGAEPGGDGSS